MQAGRTSTDLQGLPGLQEEVRYHYGIPSRELVQQFREMCLPEKIAVRIRKVKTMETAWRRLDALFKNETALIKDLMQEIRSVSTIKDGEDERLMDYYVLLQSHIEEARRADLPMLLSPANMLEMVCPLPTWEKSVWRERQGQIHTVDRVWGFAGFVEDRLEYATNMVATSERLVLPKPIPLHRPPRSPSSESRGGRYDRGSSGRRNTRVMATREDRSADRKKVRFLPPKAWDPKAKWTQECVMFQECGEKHSPEKCEVFKKMTPQQRLKKIDERELCRLCHCICRGGSAGREGHGRGQHRGPGHHGRTCQHRAEVPTGQGLGEQAGEAGKGRGAADWHGQSGLDAQAHWEQPGERRQPEADAVRAGTGLHPDGKCQGDGTR
jgi:hypothetical protein